MFFDHGTCVVCVIFSIFNHAGVALLGWPRERRQFRLDQQQIFCGSKIGLSRLGWVLVSHFSVSSFELILGLRNE